ncbi:MAG: hypothetical protein JXX29_23765 [Deltaproteobacteria bacterium]|nr:hypothetical protein [Deltaproteobacteria bacterium]MBN2674719.1 hypothetical protein [Deltaproteobacteria bacterium]
MIDNRSINEGIGIPATLHLWGDNSYFQDITIMNKAVYGDTASYSVTGRHVALVEESDNNIYKNVRLLSTQDTYYTRGDRSYWEGGEIHGTTDFDGTYVDTLLTEGEAAQYTIENVLGGWDPQQYTRQVAAPTATQSGTTVTWNAASNARCWVVFRNGVYVDGVTTASYDISSFSAGDTITVRAANEMGGLGAASNTVILQ